MHCQSFCATVQVFAFPAEPADCLTEVFAWPGVGVGDVVGRFLLHAVVGLTCLTCWEIWRWRITQKYDGSRGIMGAPTLRRQGIQLGFGAGLSAPGWHLARLGGVDSGGAALQVSVACGTGMGVLVVLALWSGFQRFSVKHQLGTCWALHRCP